MGYTEITPHQFLQDYIDAYWRVTGCGLPLVQRIMPDGCVDIIVDLYGDEKVLSLKANKFDKNLAFKKH